MRVEVRSEVMETVNRALYESKLVGYPEPFRNKVRTGLDGNTEVSRVVVGNGIVGEKNAPVEPDGAWVFVENFDPLTRSVFRWTSARVMETDNRSQFDKIKMTFQ